MKKQILLVHGRASKPSKHDLATLWIEALHHGLQRDHGHDACRLLDQAELQMVYYADLTSELLGEPIETADCRRKTLEHLKQFGTHEFNNSNYRDLPGLNFYKDELASAAAAIGSLFGIADNIVAKAAPDVAEYWSGHSPYAHALRGRMKQALEQALQDQTEVLVIGHSLGAVITYDVLYQLTHDQDDKPVNNVDFISLGSPLGSNFIRNQLNGNHLRGAARYPHNIRRWTNIAGIDDYICYDDTLADDFRPMINLGLVEDIQDITGIYNLSVRKGRSNPHSSLGYLIHPDTISTVHKWLTD